MRPFAYDGVLFTTNILHVAMFLILCVRIGRAVAAGRGGGMTELYAPLHQWGQKRCKTGEELTPRDEGESGHFSTALLRDIEERFKEAKEAEA